MAANVGGIDKIVRIVAGAGLIGATVAGMLPVAGRAGPLAQQLHRLASASLMLAQGGADEARQSLEALLAILDRLQPVDRFNLVAFGSQPRAFFSGLHPADDRGLAHAVRVDQHRIEAGARAGRGDHQGHRRPVRHP